MADNTFKIPDPLKEKFKALFDQVFLKEKPGFLNTEELERLAQESKNLYSKFKTSKRVAIFGIGGSSLGTKMLSEMFGQESMFTFFENVDALGFYKKIKNIDTETHCIFVSKSGSTLETLSQISFLKQEIGDGFIKNSVVITDPKPSPLKDWADSHQIPTLDIPLNLGGRFSILSPVGMYPACFMGLDPKEFIRGASDLINYKDVCVNFCSQIDLSFSREEWVTVFWCYSDFFKNFGLWIQQLWSESLGKERTLQGEVAPSTSTPLPLVGANDQHSVLQQIISGRSDKFVVFIRNLQGEEFGAALEDSLFSSQNFLIGKGLGELLKAQYEGTQKALEEKGIHSMTLSVSQIDEYQVGVLIQFFMMCIAILGAHYKICVYDQPGVELSKKIAVDLLKSNG